MEQINSWNDKCRNIFSAILFVVIIISSDQAFSAGLTPEIESKIAAYKEKLTNWGNDKDIIKAVKEMNAQVVSMSNPTWKSLPKDSPKVMKFQNSTAGKKLTGWQTDKSLGKLFLRDQKGNFVAGSKKPAIYNIVDRKAFTKAITGKPWNSSKAKADPTTKLNSVQISVPIISNGKNIGIIHTALIIE